MSGTHHAVLAEDCWLVRDLFWAALTCGDGDNVRFINLLDLRGLTIATDVETNEELSFEGDQSPSK